MLAKSTLDDLKEYNNNFWYEWPHAGTIINHFRLLNWAIAYFNVDYNQTDFKKNRLLGNIKMLRLLHS